MRAFPAIRMQVTNTVSASARPEKMALIEYLKTL
jgi:hypothetical protein